MYQRSLGYLASKKEYTKHAATIIFIVGFLFDMFILPDIDDPITKYVGAAYLIAIALLIMFREWVVSKNTASNVEQKIYSITTFGISYFSGSALSFIFIYALRAAAFSVSWPLLVIFLLCMFANEFISAHNYRFTLDVGIFFTALLFYLMFNIPILLKTQNSLIFALSVAISIIISCVYIRMLSTLSDTAYDEAHRGFALAFGIPMFVGMLYFLHVLPAVPLSLKNAGVYHHITKTEDGQYLAQKETDTRFLAQLRTPILHMNPNDDGVYFFSAVGAPSMLVAPLSHVWEYYDADKKQWVEELNIPFTLTGGRKDGYRSYSKKQTVQPGLWRVTVEVDNNRIVGQTKFYVEIDAKEVTPLQDISL